MVLEILRNFTHLRLIKLRAVHRYVLTKTFEAAYERASEADRQIVIKYFEENNKDAIVKWTKEQLYKSKQLGELSIGELRELCVNLGVSGYRYMSKPSLLSAITNEMNNDTQRVSIESH